VELFSNLIFDPFNKLRSKNLCMIDLIDFYQGVIMDKVIHFEIPADDIERARKFYKSTFGWKMDEVPGMDYVLIRTTRWMRIICRQSPELSMED
jgi:hypothetical protein